MVASGWPYKTHSEIGDVLFAPDGHMVFTQTDMKAGWTQVVALSADGHLLPGWPWTPPQTGDPVAQAAFGPDGSVYATVRTATGDPIQWGWTLHRLDATGKELSGFPVKLSDVSSCSLTASSDGVAFTACQEDDPATGTTTATVVSAVRPDGSALPGWPVRATGAAEVAGFRPDGALVLGLHIGNAASVTVVGRDGKTLPGWPHSLKAGYGSLVVDRGGRVVVTTPAWTQGECGPATRTTYLVLGLGGRPAAGWPVTLAGWASDPEIASNGRLTVATGSGRVITYSSTGKVLPGWPATRVGVSTGCYGGSKPWSAGGGDVVVVGNGRATLLLSTGRVATGWPVKLPYTLAIKCPGCTPGPGAPVDPAVGRSNVYIATYDHDTPRIVAIDRMGSLPKALQRTISAKEDEILWVRIASTGRVWAAVMTQGTDGSVTTLRPIAQDVAVGN